MTGENPVESLVRDRNEIDTVKGIDIDSCLFENFVVDETVMDAPLKFFTNWYDIASLPVINGTTVAPVVLDYFPILFNLIATMLSTRWRFFRADMEFAIQINSTPLDYGSFLIGWNPSSIFDTVATCFDTMNADPWLFDISVGGIHVIKIPWSSVYTAIDVRRGVQLPGFHNNVPKLYLNWLNASTLGATLSSSVAIRGRFTNMKCWGSNSAVVAISSEDPVSQMEQVRNTVIAGGAILTSAHVGYKTFTGYKTQAEGVIADAKGMATVAGEVFDSTKTLFNDLTYSPTDPIDEAETHATSGVSFNQPTIFPAMTNIAYRPMENLSLTMKRIKPFGLHDPDLVHKIKDLMQIPCYLSSTDFVVGNTYTRRVSPMFNTFFNGNTDRVTYLTQFSQFFRFWRGSIDIKYTFHCSPMVSCRFTIYAEQIGTESTQSLTGTTAYLFRRHIEVTGFLELKIRVPYVFNCDWCPLTAYGPTSGGAPGYCIAPTKISISCLSITSGLAGNAATPHVYMNTFVSAGPDFQVRNLNGCKMNYFAPTPVSQMRVREKGSGYENICLGSDNPTMLRPVDEDIFTIETLLHRWSYREASSDPIDPLMPTRGNQVYATGVLPDMFDYLVNMFRYARGNVQFKMPIPTASTQQFVGVQMMGDISPFRTSTHGAGNLLGISSGTSIGSPVQNPVMEFELPVETYTEWAVCYSAQVNVIYDPEIPICLAAQVDDSSPVEFFVRAGRGFQVAYLQPPFSSQNMLFRASTNVPPTQMDSHIQERNFKNVSVETKTRIVSMPIDHLSDKRQLSHDNSNKVLSQSGAGWFR